MAILTAILVVVLILAAWLFVQLRSERLRYQELFDQHATLSDELANKKRALSEAEKSLNEANERHTALKADHKKAKERLHTLSKDKPGGPAPSGGAVAPDALIVARQELAQSRQETELQKAKVAELEARVRSLEADKAKKPEKEIAPVAVDRAAIEKEIRNELNAKLRDEKAAVSRLKKDHGREIKTLNSRLSRALRDIDKQRGRADNNEKAYQIAMNEVQKAYDKLERYEPEIRRPFVSTPDTKPVRPDKPAAPKKGGPRKDKPPVKAAEAEAVAEPEKAAEAEVAPQEEAADRKEES